MELLRHGVLGVLILWCANPAKLAKPQFAAAQDLGFAVGTGILVGFRRHELPLFHHHNVRGRQTDQREFGGEAFCPSPAGGEGMISMGAKARRK